MKNYTLGKLGTFYTHWGEAHFVTLPCSVLSYESDFLLECHDADDLRTVLVRHALACPGVDVESCLKWALEGADSVLNASQVRSGGHVIGVDEAWLAY